MGVSYVEASDVVALGMEVLGAVASNLEGILMEVLVIEEPTEVKGCPKNMLVGSPMTTI